MIHHVPIKITGYNSSQSKAGSREVVIFFFIILQTALQATNIDSLTRSLSHQQPQSDSLVLSINKQIQALIYKSPGEALNKALLLDSLADKKLDLVNAEISNTLGLSYYANEDYEKAIAYLLTALRLFEKENHKDKIAQSYNSLATVYQVRKDVATSTEYFNHALRLFQELKDTLWIASTSMNLGSHLMEYDHLEEAELHIIRALGLFENMRHSVYVGFSQLNLGSLRVKQGQPQEAISLFQKSLKNVPYEVHPLINAVANTGIGQAHLDMTNLQQAKKYLIKGYEISKSINHSEQLKSSTELLSDYYAKVKNYERAYHHQKEWGVLQDSFLNAAQDERLLDALNKYESEKKEQEILLLSAENEIKDLRIAKSRRNLILATLILIGALALAMQFYRSRKKSRLLNKTLQEQKDIITKALEEKNVLLKEIHHRVKNNLQVISSLLGLQSRKISDGPALDALKEGRSRVQSMSLIHQDLYQKDNLTSIAVRSYLEKLVSNLLDTYNISEDMITMDTDIDDLLIDVDTIIPLGLIINELISNALKYAFPDGEGKIIVTLKDKDEGLHLVVQDNGIGISNPEEIKDSDSFGYDLITSLLDKLDGALSINVNNGTSISALIKDYKLAA